MQTFVHSISLNRVLTALGLLTTQRAAHTGTISFGNGKRGHARPSHATASHSRETCPRSSPSDKRASRG